jgi:hypothetical protein
VSVHAKEFYLPKQGSSEAEYEDAFSLGKDELRFAVADGATETSFSGVWARQLVRAFTHGKLSVPITIEELKPLQSQWEKIVHRNPLPWYAEEKAGSGAFAAFIGLEFLPKKIWRATAAGDSCLVQMRDDEMMVAFPLADSGSFSNRPDLLSSAPAMNGKEAGLVLSSTGSWDRADVFFLMTDALACWFFKEREQGNKPWLLLKELEAQSQAPFGKLIANLRSEGRMKNDDVTLVRIEMRL